MFENPLKKLKEADQPLQKIPQSVQNTMEILAVGRDGMFKVKEEKYSKTYELSDINYDTADDPGKLEILEQYYDILSLLEHPSKITILNRKKDIEQFEDEILYAYKDENDGLNECRRALNENIEEKTFRTGNKGMEQERFLTVTITKRTYEEAEEAFRTMERKLAESFEKIECRMTPLSGDERLNLLKSIYRAGEDDRLPISIDDCILHGGDFKNDLAPSFMQFPPEGKNFRIGNKYCEALYMERFPNGLSDSFLMELSNLPTMSIVAVDFIQLDKPLTVGLLERIYMGIEGDIYKQQQKRNSKGAFSSDISYRKRKEKEDIEGMLNAVRDEDQNLFLVGINLVLMADSPQELQSCVQTAKTIATTNNFRLVNHLLKQREAFNTVLPIGVRQTDKLRSMLTQSLAAFVPFKIMELSEAGQIAFYGINQLSLNAILGNRKHLFNGNGFYLGMPGSGKSFDNKIEKACVLCGSDDDVLIIDPTLEYVDVAHQFGGSVIIFSNDSDHYINPFHFDLNSVDALNEKGKSVFETIIKDKCQLMIAICKSYMKDSFGGKHRSVVDEAVRNMLHRIKELPKNERYIPILTDFAKELQQLNSAQAEDVYDEIKILIEGSLNLFNHQTNVDIDNRFVVYGIRDVDRELFPLVMLIMLDHVDARIEQNFKKKRATWLDIDEIHELLHNEFSAEYLEKCWKKHRKLGGIDTGLTQNISDMMKSDIAKTMINNSQFFMILRQNPDDIEDILGVVPGITKEMTKYILKAGKGTGLLKHGDVILPFDNRIEKENPLYRIFNTNLHEKAEEEKEESA